MENNDALPPVCAQLQQEKKKVRVGNCVDINVMGILLLRFHLECEEEMGEKKKYIYISAHSEFKNKVTVRVYQ